MNEQPIVLEAYTDKDGRLGVRCKTSKRPLAFVETLELHYDTATEGQTAIVQLVLPVGA